MTLDGTSYEGGQERFDFHSDSMVTMICMVVVHFITGGGSYRESFLERFIVKTFLLEESICHV